MSHVLCKVGDELGFFALLNAPSLDDAKALVERSAQRLEAFEVDYTPSNTFLTSIDILAVVLLTRWVNSEAGESWRPPGNADRYGVSKGATARESPPA